MARRGVASAVGGVVADQAVKVKVTNNNTTRNQVPAGPVSSATHWHRVVETGDDAEENDARGQ